MDNYINKRIAELRNLKGLTQADFANCLGIKPSTYSRKESKGTFKPEELSKIATLLGITIAELFSENTDNQKANANVPEKLRQPSPSNTTEENDVFPLTPPERNVLQILRHASKNDKKFILEVVEYCYKKPNISAEKADAVMNELKK
ncbi:MAG: helix-turn-helix transcriptional regulator [Oscillospiraceae bacterium]|nr:helix-turn-helix transcriptional regulator [Oscillospiraceae bacterium]